MSHFARRAKRAAGAVGDSLYPINLRTVPSVVLSPSAWPYRKLPDNTPVHASSGSIISNLIYQAETFYGSPGSPSVNFEMSDYSTSLVRVYSSDPIISVTKPGDTYLDSFMSGVRLYDEVSLPAGTDSNISVWQQDANRIWDAWMFNKTATRTYTVGQSGINNAANSWDGRYIGAMQGRGANAAGITAAAVHTRIHELLGSYGRYNCGCPIIPHVINWALPELYGGIKDVGGAWVQRKFSFPAARTDGRNSTDPDARLWMGQMVRLPAHINVHAIANTKLMRALLHATQNYGLIATDTAGAVAIGGDNPAVYTAAERNDFQNLVLGPGRQIWQELAGFPLASLEALPIDYQVP